MDECRALYAEGGADPGAASDVVREALLTAQVLGQRRPIDEAVLWTQSLREVVAQHKPALKQVDQSDRQSRRVSES